MPRRSLTLPPRLARAAAGPGERAARRGTQGAGAGLHSGPVSSAVPKPPGGLTHRTGHTQTKLPTTSGIPRADTLGAPPGTTHSPFPLHKPRRHPCLSLQLHVWDPNIPRPLHTLHTRQALSGGPHSHLRRPALTPFPAHTHPLTRSPHGSHPSHTQSSRMQLLTHALPSNTHLPSHTQMLHKRPPPPSCPRGAGGVWGPPLSPAEQTSGPFSPPGQRKAACPASAAGGAARQAAQHCGLVPPGGPREGSAGRRRAAGLLGAETPLCPPALESCPFPALHLHPVHAKITPQTTMVPRPAASSSLHA